MLRPRGPVDGAVVPDPFKVVVDDVAVVRRAVGRGVEPPDFVEALIGTRDDLLDLVVVDVAEDVLAQGAGQGLNAARVDEELVPPHPVDDVVDRDDGVLRGHRHVLVKQGETPDERSADVLHREERRVRPDKDLLTGVQRRDKVRAMREFLLARLVRDFRHPLKPVRLV